MRGEGRTKRRLLVSGVVAIVACAGVVASSDLASAFPTTAVVELQVAGRAGIPVDAEAVVLNVTATNTAAAGFVTVWPCGLPMPEASNLNFVAGRDVANLVISRIGVDGKVCLKASANTDVIADAAGYFPAGSGYEPATSPVRILDTRNGTGRPAGLVAAGDTVDLQVGGQGGVPMVAEAVVMNVTAASTQGPGFVTVHPCDQPLPTASNLNFGAGQDGSNLVMTRLAADGTVCLFADNSTHLIADVAGHFPAGSDYQPSSNPTRIFDTRSGLGAAQGAVNAGATVEVEVGGNGGVSVDAEAVVLNVTVTQAAVAGFATVYPCGPSVPNASNVNYSAGHDIANLVITPLDGDGTVCIYTSGSVHLIADVAGHFPAGSSYVPLASPTRLLDSRNIAPPVVPAPPGRLPPVDVTDEILALFPTPFTASSALELAVEVGDRLNASFTTMGFFADLRGVSLTPVPGAGGEAMAYVIEVRNREESGDDTTPGYDLVITMEPDATGTWVVTAATRQTICSRGIDWSTDPPLCV